MIARPQLDPAVAKTLDHQPQHAAAIRALQPEFTAIIPSSWPVQPSRSPPQYKQTSRCECSSSVIVSFMAISSSVQTHAGAPSAGLGCVEMLG